MPHFIMLHFIALDREFLLFFFFFTSLGFVATLCWASLSAPLFQQHLLTSCLCGTFWQFLQYFKLFHHYDIGYGDLWSVIFDVTIVLIIALGCHRPQPYKTANLDKCVRSDCSTDQLFPISLPLLGPPYFLRHNNIEIRPINNPTIGL